MKNVNIKIVLNLLHGSKNILVLLWIEFSGIINCDTFSLTSSLINEIKKRHFSILGKGNNAHCEMAEYTGPNVEKVLLCSSHF